MKLGKTVAHYTLELNEGYVGQRYDAVLSKIAVANLKYNMEDVKNNNYEDLIFDFLEDDDDEDDDVKKIIREAKKKIKIPTLDGLLEKIHERIYQKEFHCNCISYCGVELLQKLWRHS